jgi:hypothetical protein
MVGGRGGASAEALDDRLAEAATRTVANNAFSAEVIDALLDARSLSRAKGER